MAFKISSAFAPSHWATYLVSGDSALIEHCSDFEKTLVAAFVEKHGFAITVGKAVRFDWFSDGKSESVVEMAEYFFAS